MDKTDENLLQNKDFFSGKNAKKTCAGGKVRQIVAPISPWGLFWVLIVGSTPSLFGCLLGDLTAALRRKLRFPGSASLEPSQAPQCDRCGVLLWLGFLFGHLPGGLLYDLPGAPIRIGRALAASA